MPFPKRYEDSQIEVRIYDEHPGDRTQAISISVDEMSGAIFMTPQRARSLGQALVDAAAEYERWYRHDATCPHARDADRRCNCGAGEAA